MRIKLSRIIQIMQIRRMMLKGKMQRKKLMMVKTLQDRYQISMMLKKRHLKTSNRMIPRVLKVSLKTIHHRTPNRHGIQKYLNLNNQNRKNDRRKITKNMEMITIMINHSLPKKNKNNNQVFFLLMATTMAKTTVEVKIIMLTRITSIPKMKARNINKIRLKIRTIITIMTNSTMRSIKILGREVKDITPLRNLRILNREVRDNVLLRNRRTLDREVKDNAPLRNRKTLDREVRDNVPLRNRKILDREGKHHHLQLYKVDQVQKWSTSMFW